MTVKSESQNYLTTIVGRDIVVDATKAKGGTGLYIRPHELLEAALATCLNISLRMEAQKNNIHLNEVETRVELDRSDPENSVFEYSFAFTPESAIGEGVLKKLKEAVRECPVKKTLAKKLLFREKDAESIR